jgi:signal transduction histidine kinase
MLSVKSLFPVLLAVHLLFGGLVFALFKNDRSARYWVLGCLSAAMGISLILLRGSAPYWLTFLVGNFFSFFGWFLFFISIQILISNKSKLLYWSILLCLLHVFCIDLIFRFNLEKYIAIYIGVVWSAMNLYFYWQIYKANKQLQNKFVGFMAYLYLGSSILWATRIILSQVYDFNFVMDDGIANWLTMLANTLLIVVRQLDYFAIRYSLLGEEKLRIEQLLEERESLIANLLRANKTAATGALSASIAHELNQPLGASNLNIQFLKMKLDKGALNPELGKEVLDSLEVDNQRAATIVKSLRSIFTEGESNSQEVQLGDSISRVLDIVKPELKSKSIQIQLRVEEGCVVRINPSEIEQVILNLVNNAAQSLANSATLQRHIAIEASKVGEQVQLSISDNGAGVPAEFKSQLFELLNTTKKTGMGLGLWLCKHIVTRYNGSIHYEDAVGGGAKFVVKLPVADK